MEGIPDYKIGDVVTIRKECHKGYCGSDYLCIFDVDKLKMFGGRKFIIKQYFKEDALCSNVPDDGVRYVLAGFPTYFFSAYMFEESGNWWDKGKMELKDGDYISFGVKNEIIGIFKEFDRDKPTHTDYVTLSNGRVFFNIRHWISINFRPATEDEKRKLFDAMEKTGIRWNAEKKCVEGIPPETEEKPFRYGGDIADFPPEIVEKMLEYQERQGNQRNIKVFEKDRWSLHASGGFSWIDTDEGFNFWDKVILCKKFDIFFERYPKDNPESVPTAVGISQDTADDLNVYIERLKDQLYESMRDQIYELTKDPCDFCGFYPSPGKIKTRSRKPIPKGGLYRKKKGFRPFGEVEKVKPVETRLHTKSK